MNDLEHLSKSLGFVNLSKMSTFKERIEKNKNFVPKWMKEDPNFRFGKPAYIPGNQRIGPVLKNDFLKEFLTKNITN